MTVMIGFGLVQSIRVHRYEEMPSGRGVLAEASGHLLGSITAREVLDRKARP